MSDTPQISDLRVYCKALDNDRYDHSLDRDDAKELLFEIDALRAELADLRESRMSAPTPEPQSRKRSFISRMIGRGK